MANRGYVVDKAVEHGRGANQLTQYGTDVADADDSVLPGVRKLVQVYVMPRCEVRCTLQGKSNI